MPTLKWIGKEVHAAIERIGGTLPEQIPPAEHIKVVEKRIKNSVPLMKLDEKDGGQLARRSEQSNEA
jgi:DNA-damage-inducible protein D